MVLHRGRAVGNSPFSSNGRFNSSTPALMIRRSLSRSLSTVGVYTTHESPCGCYPVMSQRTLHIGGEHAAIKYTELRVTTIKHNRTHRAQSDHNRTHRAQSGHHKIHRAQGVYNRTHRARPLHLHAGGSILGLRELLRSSSLPPDEEDALRGFLDSVGGGDDAPVVSSS